MLQWGHGSEAVEHRAPASSGGRLDSSLQWGHGSEAVEIAAAERLSHEVASASMGPRL